MSDALTSLLLLAALACWYVQYARTASPVVSRCARCGDLVQHAPGLPACCPSCGQFTLI